MHTRAVTAAVGFVVAIAIAPAATRAQEPPRREVAGACAAIESIAYGDFGYGRYGDAWARSPGASAVGVLAALELPVAELDALLRHADPKLRTIALLLLFAREEPELLPRIAAFTSDTAATFPAPEPFHQPAPGVHTPPPLRAVSVGEVAQQLLAFWYQAAGMDRPPAEPERAFDAWWQAHRRHLRGAVCMRLRLMRATGGCAPCPPAWLPRVQRVRAAVDAMPSPDRELLLIVLPEADTNAGSALATDAERAAAARRLGDDVLLRCLRGDFPSDDPCWRQWSCRDGAFGYDSALHRFVLASQDRIFARSAAPRLLELEAEQRRIAANTTGFVDVGWVITAASLQPEHATAWLVPALARFREPHEALQRSMLLRTLVLLGDDTTTAAVAATFWDDGFVSWGVQTRVEMLRALPDVPSQKARALLRALVDAPAFQDSDPLTTIELGKAAGGLLGKQPIPDALTQPPTHPLGLDRLVTNAQRAAAQKAHPAETQRVLDAVEPWREAIVNALR